MLTIPFPDIRLGGHGSRYSTRGQFNMFPNISRLFSSLKGEQSLQPNWRGPWPDSPSPASATDYTLFIHCASKHRYKYTTMYLQFQHVNSPMKQHFAYYRNFEFNVRKKR